jgi:predicted transcriptional regulator
MSAQAIALPSELVDSLEQIARERGQSVQQVVEEVVREYLREERHSFLLAEMERFRTQHAELRASHPDQYVAMRDGLILDSDADGGALYARVSRQHGEQPILIVKVTETPEQEFTVRNPRLETAP